MQTTRVTFLTRPEWEQLGSSLAGTAGVTITGVLTEPAKVLDGLGLVTHDVLVIDAGLTASRLPAFCERVARRAPHTAILLAATADDDLLYRSVVRGARSVVPIDSAPLTLATAIRGTAHGEAWLSPGIAARLLLDMEAFTTRHADPLDPPPSLTALELDLLDAIADRVPIDELAAAHRVTPRLVAIQLGYAVAKLQRSYRVDQDLFDFELEPAHSDDLPD